MAIINPKVLLTKAGTIKQVAAFLKRRGMEPSTALALAVAALAGAHAFPAFAPILEWIVAGGVAGAVLMPERGQNEK